MPVQYDRVAFFERARQSVFYGNMDQGQVDGCNAILAEAEERQLSPAQTAYLLATPWWETMQEMRPVREIGRGAGRVYGRPDPVTHQTYYGRGLVQITWKDNYQKFAHLLKVDLVGNPDLALDLNIAVKILFEGMTRGVFTGRKLSDYIHDDICDYLNARRIINGMDHASTIAATAQKFAHALT